jgi:hypothetical protein
MCKSVEALTPAAAVARSILRLVTFSVESLLPVKSGIKVKN